MFDAIGYRHHLPQREYFSLLFKIWPLMSILFFLSFLHVPRHFLNILRMGRRTEQAHRFGNQMSPVGYCDTPI